MSDHSPAAATILPAQRAVVTGRCPACEGDCGSQYPLPSVARLRPGRAADFASCHFCAARDVVVTTVGGTSVLLDGQARIRWAGPGVGTAWSGLVEDGVERRALVRFGGGLGGELVVHVDGVGRFVFDDVRWRARAAAAFATYERETGVRASWCR